MTTTAHPKRRTRRLLQFSLRTLLVFVLLVSIGMSWFAVKLERARKQREAVEAIRAAGGVVVYDYQSDDYNADPPVPRWLRELLGHDFFFDVVYVWFERDFGDDEASHLKALTNLTHLILTNMQITDAGLEHISGLTNLSSLGLRNTEVTDAGLKHLEGLTSLTTLDLADTQVSDAAHAHLKGLTGLEYLSLHGTQVTPEGVKKLQSALPECQILYDE